MDFWNECPDEVLITIFKNFDLKTRMKAGLTCRRWYELLKDPRTNMDDISQISFRINPDKDNKRWKKKLMQNTLVDIIKNAIEGVSNHVGKAHSFYLEEDDPIILSLISQMVNDGLLKVDQFSSRIEDEDFSRTDWLNAILPSSIRELDLSGDEHQPKILICDWSLLPRLQRLTLSDTWIDLSITSPPLLKYLAMGFNEDNHDQLPSFLNTTLPYLPQLEELHVFSCLEFDDQSFRNFLLTIKEKLSNLRRLIFENVNFNLAAISNEFKYGFSLDSLEDIEFFDYDYDRDGNWLDVVQLFSRICPSSAIIHVSTRLVCLESSRISAAYNDLAALTTRENTKLALHFILEAATNDFESLATPSEFGQALVNLIVANMKSTIFLQKFFNCNSYEKLIKIHFHNCEGLNDEILKIISQSCPRLKNMVIHDCKGITENGLKSFLIYWEKRRSKKLSIKIDQFAPPIDRLFGTSFEEGRGILDERWMMEEENEGPTSEKKQKISMENRKRWGLYRKTFTARYGCDDLGIRLVIWDQGNPLDGFNQKVLVIKNYFSYSSNYSNYVGVNPI